MKYLQHGDDALLAFVEDVRNIARDCDPGGNLGARVKHLDDRTKLRVLDN